MPLFILNCSLEPKAATEANIQQAFVNILDDDVINPLRTLKVSQEHFIQEGIPALIIGRSGRKRMMRRESALKKVSRNPPRHMPVMQRTQSRSSSRHSRRNTTLGNVHTLLRFRNVLKTFRTKLFWPEHSPIWWFAEPCQI